MLTPDEFLNADLMVPENDGQVMPIGFGAMQADKTTKKDYRAAYIYINVTSSSQRGVLHDCARKYQIAKIPSAVEAALAVPARTVEERLVSPQRSSTLPAHLVSNIDFIFGHAVGAGVQTYLATKSRSAALFACFLAWTGDYDQEHPKKQKNSSYAALAVEKFIYFWKEKNFEAEWDLAYFGEKPATELTFLIDCENGYYHAGHVDAVLRHKRTGRYMVLEIKTTAIRTIDEAQYGNSEQPLGYSIVVDKVAETLEASSEFEVLYMVYSSTNREWRALPFTKSRSHRMDWLQELLLDHTFIGTYRKIELFPKNGDACWSFNSRCPHYGVCDLSINQQTNFKVLKLEADHSNLPEPVDFFFTLSELTNAALRGNLETSTVQDKVQ